MPRDVAGKEMIMAKDKSPSGPLPKYTGLIIALYSIPFILLLILVGIKEFASWLVTSVIIVGWLTRKSKGWTPSFHFLFEDDIADGE
jgi:hypothetical protein